MLAKLAHPMSVPFSTRRSAQAALLLLSLVGTETPDSAVDAEPTHLRVHLAGYTLWATRCDKPLLLEDAAVLARAGRRDVLIMRLATSLHPASPLTFDWIPTAAASSRPRCGLLPALPFGGGLALVDPHDERARLDVTANAILNRCDLPATWPAQRELAMARANAVLNSQLWGGL
ncbi:MAG TPA: hypothetical protein VFP12_00540 [Allosphingosinicella sp.]|nr:hypothetical protein [Allosphingosinicella sp.]